MPSCLGIQAAHARAGVTGCRQAANPGVTCSAPERGLVDTPDRGGRCGAFGRASPLRGWAGPIREPPMTQYAVLKTTEETRGPDAYDPAAGPKGPPGEDEQDEDAGAEGQPAAAGCLHPRVHDDPEEAQLGAAEGRARPPDQFDRGDRVHPGRGPQPAGALDGAGARRPGKGPTWRALQDHPGL